MDPIPPPEPPKVTLAQVITHIVTAIIVALACFYFNKPIPANMAAPAYTQATTTPPEAVTAPQGATVAPKTTAPAAMLLPPPLPTVLKVDTLRIEAGTVQLVGDVHVAIPEIKPPNVIIENKLPQSVIDALTKPQAAPVVNVTVPNALPHITPAALPDPVKDSTMEGELLPPPKLPVRVLPTIQSN